MSTSSPCAPLNLQPCAVLALPGSPSLGWRLVVAGGRRLACGSSPQAAGSFLLPRCCPRCSGAVATSCRRPVQVKMRRRTAPAPPVMAGRPGARPVPLGTQACASSRSKTRRGALSPCGHAPFRRSLSCGSLAQAGREQRARHGTGVGCVATWGRR
eukprot:scaffold680_cov309-Prasinococcus_capsulatus_cf.AAC.5